jgi:hypothetical protein
MERAPNNIYWTGGWLGHKTDLKFAAKREIPILLPGIELLSSSHFSDVIFLSNFSLVVILLNSSLVVGRYENNCDKNANIKQSIIYTLKKWKFAYREGGHLCEWLDGKLEKVTTPSHEFV